MLLRSYIDVFQASVIIAEYDELPANLNFKNTYDVQLGTRWYKCLLRDIEQVKDNLFRVYYTAQKPTQFDSN